MMIYISSVPIFHRDSESEVRTLKFHQRHMICPCLYFIPILVEIQPPPIMMIYISSGPAFCRDSKFKVRNLQIHQWNPHLTHFCSIYCWMFKIQEGIGLYSQISPLQSYVSHATHMCVSIYHKWKHLSPIFIIAYTKKAAVIYVPPVIKLSQWQHYRGFVEHYHVLKDQEPHVTTVISVD